MGIGRLLVLAGAAVVLWALAQPFYVLHAPVATAARPTAAAGPDGLPGSLAALLTPAPGRLASGGGVAVDAWTVFAHLDTALLAGVLVALVLVGLGAAGLVSAGGLRIVWVAGLAGAAAVAYHALVPPGPAAVVSPAEGAWALLAGLGLLVLGGWLVSSPD